MENQSGSGLIAGAIPGAREKERTPLPIRRFYIDQSGMGLVHGLFARVESCAARDKVKGDVGVQQLRTLRVTGHGHQQSDNRSSKYMRFHRTSL